MLPPAFSIFALAPALIRIWGVEELAKKMLRGDLTDEHRQIIALVQSINLSPRDQG